MGQQHSSHVANGTDQTIKIVLTDNNNRNTSQIIEDGNHCCIPTIHGTVTLSVFPEESQGNAFVTTSVASFTNDSNHNFIVKKDNSGRINIYRAMYGTIWEIESGVQQTNNKEMRQQHNSHVANGTDQTIKVVLTDNNNRNTSQIIEYGTHCCIPTIHGTVTLSVFPEEPQGNGFVTTSVASLKNDSDRSFIVKKDNSGRINIYRAKYGTIWQIKKQTINV